VVYDPELAHCSALDPELEQAVRIKALLAVGTLAPFETLPATTVVA